MEERKEGMKGERKEGWEKRRKKEKEYIPRVSINKADTYKSRARHK